jgi:hypothetical protein
LLEDTRSLVRRLQEISEIMTKYKTIFDLFSNQEMIQQWPKEFSVHIIDLADEMAILSRTNQIDILNRKLTIVKALIKLDEYLKGDKYATIYQEYQKAFHSQTDHISQEVIDAIKIHDYEKIAFKMTALESSGQVGQHFFQQSKRAVNIAVKDLLD